MAFEGDLSNLGLGDVLQAIAMSRQVGTFVIRGEDERRLACGPHGVALLSSKKSLGLKIGTVLVGTGKVTQKQLDEALKIQSRKKGTLLGQILADSGSCSADDVRISRRYLAAEEIFGLFMWKEGQFEFLSDEPVLAGPFADLWFDVGSLAMEAARRIDEMPRLAQAVPEGEVFVPATGPCLNRDEILANPDTRWLLGLADGTRTVRDIADEFYRGRFDTLKGLHALSEAGLIRTASAAEVTAAGRAATAARDHRRAARLYRRASAHDTTDDTLRQAIADALREAGERLEAAVELTNLGYSRLEAGKELPAIESFRAALRLDSANPGAHEGHMRALAESGLTDEAAEAAQSAARLLVESGDFDGALRVAEIGLAQRPEDTHLLVQLANARHGLGLEAEALQALDEAVRVLGAAGGDRRRLLDVYRRMAQIDPAHGDCERRISEIQAGERTRRRKLAQRAAIAAGVLVLAGAAIPLLGGRSVASQLEKAQALIEAKNPAEARAVLAALAGRTLSEDEQIDRQNVETRLAALTNPSAAANAKKVFVEKLDGLNKRGINSICGDGKAPPGADEPARVADGLASLIEEVDALDTPEARSVAAADAAGFKQIRTAALKAAMDGLDQSAEKSQLLATKLAALRDRFTEDVWKREDLDVLHDLISQSAKVVETVRPEEWERVPALVAEFVRRTQKPKNLSDRKTVAAAGVIADAARQISVGYERALSRARRKEVKEGYKSAYSAGTQFERDGRVEEALARYDAFLTQCDELRSAEPAALYAATIAELFGSEWQLDQRIRSRRERLATVLRESDQAQQAEADDDVETAFRLRRHLVHDHPDLDLSHRFQMPLRIESAPPDAEVYVADGSAEGRLVGTTPVVVTYAIAGGTKYDVRRAGYRSVEILRKGAAEDTSGLLSVELPKLATWTSKPAGITEASPIGAGGAILTAGRNGVIRRIDANSGEETARFEPGLLDGFASAPVTSGGRVYAASLDGKTFVLDLERLTKIREIATGPVRAAPVVTRRGVLVADESGTTRLLDADGGTVWQKPLGRVKCDPAIAGDRAILVTCDAEVLCVDLASGDVVKRRRLKNEVLWGPPAVHGNRAFVGNEAGQILCIDTTTLDDAWLQRLEGPVRGHVATTDLRLIACTASGAVHVLDAETGGVLSKTLVGGKTEDGPCALPDGGFVIVTRRGNATRFDSRAHVVWRYDAGEDVTASPQLIDGKVILVTRHGVVISLTP